MKRVYISSTYTDLTEYRTKVYDQLRKMGYDPHAMEDYTATEERPLAYCLEDVAKCDIYIAIIAWRYGYIPKDDPANELSITELEYIHAGNNHIPRFIFVLNDHHPWSLLYTDSHTGEGNGGKAIRDFRSRLQQAHITGFYTTPEDLANQVSAAIAKWEKTPRSLSQAQSPQDHREQVITQITELLRALSVTRQRTIAESLNAYAIRTDLNLPLSLNSSTLAHDLAICMVDQIPVLEIIPRLLQLTDGASPAESHRIADIVDLLLPLNYIPDVVETLRSQVTQGGCGLVEHEVTTWSLAEIIMAGYEQKAALFHVQKTGIVRGKTAEDYREGAPVGPGNNSAVVSGSRYAVRETLVHLLTCLQATPQRMGPPDVEADIIDYAGRLQQVLKARQALNRHERQTYFVLQLPDDKDERDSLKTVLDDVSQKVPGLFFIELAMRPKHEDESAIDQYLCHIIQHIRSTEESLS